MPQSNQRGIETTTGTAVTEGRFECLNRTSVGLKLINLIPIEWRARAASIEPAWD